MYVLPAVLVEGGVNGCARTANRAGSVYVLPAELVGGIGDSVCALPTVLEDRRDE